VGGWKAARLCELAIARCRLRRLTAFFDSQRGSGEVNVFVLQPPADEKI
jgi:hypothetical protein